MTSQSFTILAHCVKVDVLLLTSIFKISTSSWARGHGGRLETVWSLHKTFSSRYCQTVSQPLAHSSWQPRGNRLTRTKVTQGVRRFCVARSWWKRGKRRSLALHGKVMSNNNLHTNWEALSFSCVAQLVAKTTTTNTEKQLTRFNASHHQ